MDRGFEGGGGWGRMISSLLDKDLFRLVFPQREIIAADFDFNRVAQWGESDQFHGGSNEKTHLENPAAVFCGNPDLGDDGALTDLQRSQWLGSGGHSRRRGVAG
jgi:hypothetical protein